MMLRYSFNLGTEADMLEAAVERVLATKRTGDIMDDGCELVTTTQMGDAVIAELS